MRLIPIESCRAGMKLGSNVYDDDGRILLSVHAELTQALVRRMQQYGVEYVYIEDPRTSDVIVPQVLDPETKSASLRQIKKAFRMGFDRSDRRSLLQSAERSKEMKTVVHSLIDDLSRHQDACIMLMNQVVSDQYLYEHSLNVSIYAVLFGFMSGYTRDELTVLAIGAMLHDIGKVKVPPSILQKAGPLTSEEYREVQKHTEYGFDILRQEPSISLLSAHCAYQHHERLNGSGYPRGLRGDDIHDFAKWLGIIDSYDAMTSHRVYRGAMLPHQAMEVIFSGAGSLFDAEKVQKFRDKVALYPIGISVRLSNGTKGVVVDVNSAYPQRPVVRILEDEEGIDLLAPYDLDLSKVLNIVIAGVNEH